MKVYIFEDFIDDEWRVRVFINRESAERAAKGAMAEVTEVTVE